MYNVFYGSDLFIDVGICVELFVVDIVKSC